VGERERWVGWIFKVSFGRDREIENKDRDIE
jgi:hypothetical protein